MIMAAVGAASSNDDDGCSYVWSETEAAADKMNFRGHDWNDGPPAAAAAAEAIIEGGQPQMTEAISMRIKTSGLKERISDV